MMAEHSLRYKHGLCLGRGHHLPPQSDRCGLYDPAMLKEHADVFRVNKTYGYQIEQTVT